MERRRGQIKLGAKDQKEENDVARDGSRKQEKNKV